VLPPYFLRPLTHLSISDLNKTKLVRSPGLLTLLLHALFGDTDESHPRKDMPAPNCAGIQLDGCECVAQIALFDRGRELLQQDSSLAKALQVVQEHGLSPEAKGSAGRALVALHGMEDLVASHGHIGSKHVMLSYQWDHQQMMICINASLQKRLYNTWIDVERMKGSIMVRCHRCWRPASHERSTCWFAFSTYLLLHTGHTTSELAHMLLHTGRDERRHRRR
jgi:hypothetical protein